MVCLKELVSSLRVRERKVKVLFVALGMLFLYREEWGAEEG